MKKILKRSMGLICSLALIVSTISPSIAQAKEYCENDVTVPFVESELIQDLALKYSSTPQVIDEDTVFLPLTEAENINYIADTQKISRYEAKELMNEKSFSSIVSSDSITDNRQSVSAVSAVTYVDQYGMVLKRFNVYTGIIHMCTIAATINVCLRQYSDYDTHREFVAIYDQGITLYNSSLFQWSTNTCSAVIKSNGHIQLNASGNATATVDRSLTIDLEAAGFSIIDIGLGTTFFVTKFVIFDWDFDPTYPGAILY
jgi:hypothetical protein